MERDIKRHIIAARNFIFGSTNFLILPMPEGWKLGGLIIPPEVDANIMADEIQWVREGQVGYVLFEAGKKRSIELIIKILKGKKELSFPKNMIIHSEEQLDNYVHSIKCYSGERLKGFIKKRRFRILFMKFYCDCLDRMITLEFSTEDPLNLSSILTPLVPFIQCH